MNFCALSKLDQYQEFGMPTALKIHQVIIVLLKLLFLM